LKKYIAQPQFSSNTAVNIYDITPGASPTLFMTLYAKPNSAIAKLVGPYDPNNPSGPNSVLVYQDLAASPSPLTSSPQQFLLIAYVAQAGQSGAVYVFDLDKLLQSGGTGSPPYSVPFPDTASAVLTFPGYDPIGMALQPGTGNLYVATPSVSGGNPTVTVFAKTPGGTWSATGDSTTFDYNSLGGWSSTPSNFAFDMHGFLWMTSFGSVTDPATGVVTPYNYLTCFRNSPGSAPEATTEFWFDDQPDAGGSGTQLSVTPLLTGLTGVPATLFGLSSPEGIAFDPAGNLWVASNNEEYVGSDVNPKFDGAGGGSLLMIRAEYLLGLLFPSPPTGEILLSAIPSESVVVYYINNQAQPGGLFFDGFNLYINDENNYDADGNSILWQMTVNSDGTPATALTQVAAPVQTTNPGNGTMAVFNYPPFSFPTATLAQLLIRDGSPAGSAEDTGNEPDTATTPATLFESPDIGIAAAAISGVPGLGSGAGQSDPYDPATPPFSALNGEVDYSVPLTGGDPGEVLVDDTAFIFVQVTNVDTVASVGGETLKVYWAHASTALQWPDPWTGLTPDSADTTQTLGGLIGAVSLASIPAGQACLVQMLWSGVPAPLSFTDSSPGSAAQAHFCLLARIEGNGLYPFGMTYPEEWNFNAGGTLGTNVQNNRGVAWRNIKIQEAGATGDLKINVLGGNYGLVEKVVGFQLQTLDQNGTPAPIPAKVTVVAGGAARERFLEAERESKLSKIGQEIVHFVESVLGFEHLGEGRFRWNDLEKGMSNLRLKPGELLPFSVEFTPDDAVESFALRVLQYEEIDGKAKVTGGQTFVSGTVKGFPVRKFPVRTRR
jgi:hypothetical protein